MNRRQRRRSDAFTLIELLIVISIFVILLAIGVPAFSSMLYSSEQSLAENALRTGIAAARDAAIRSAEGEDAAAVFFFDPGTGRESIVPCIRAGTVKDGPQNPQANQLVEREVFVPVPGFEPVQLPRGWSVRGYAPEGMIEDPNLGSGHYWYTATYPTATARDRGNWLFPESGFYDETTASDAEYRNSFMIRFEGGTGMLKQDATAVLVLALSPSATVHQQSPWSLYPSGGQFPLRPDVDADLSRFVRRIGSWPVTGQGLSVTQRIQILGGDSCDTVLVKPVGQLALCSEKKLASAIGVRLDAVTNSLYRDPTTLTPPSPMFVAVNGVQQWSDPYTIRVNDWIEDHLYLAPAVAPPPGSPPDDTRTPSDCRIFSIQRYLGNLQDISGTVAGQGVSS